MSAAAAMTATLPAFVTRIRLRAERHVLWLRKLWGAAADSPTRALAISDEDVDLILADREALADQEAAFYRTHGRARELSASIDEADAATKQDRNLALLRRVFQLSDSEVDLLSLAIAIDADPMLRRVYGYIHDDATLGYATPWLAAALFGAPASASFAPASPLVKWRLAHPVEAAGQVWAAATPWAADPFATALVLHGQLHDPAIGSGLELTDAAHAEPLVLYPSELEELERFVRAVPGSRIEIEIVGTGGTGRRTLAAQLCARLGMSMLAVDVTLPQNDADRAFRVARLARVATAIVYVYGGESSALAATCPMIIQGTEAPRLHVRGGVARKTIVLPRLAREARRTLWETLSDLPIPGEVSDWALTPAEVSSVAAVAPAGEAELAAACRRAVHRAPGELFARLACPYGWDDIVLPAAVRQHLEELENQTRLRAAVLEEWGFARVHPGARGVSALFAGPSGTGKTMAAQVLARSLGLEVYRVDLAGVVNKYIGETEKRLKLVFDTCERSNVLLFFDEADALFGQRTQVKDAHDRFANIEIDYLLQRMEQFDGLAVLATNRRSDLDRAFLRRLRFIVEFVQPGPAERLALWRRALPEETPAGEPLLDRIDFDVLASRLAMSGAAIMTAGLGAAFLARAEGTRIAMRHVLAAARREMTKSGIEVRTGDLEAVS